MNGNPEKPAGKQQMQPARGTQDFIGAQAALYRRIESAAWEVAQLYGYEGIQTPIFEFSDVFHRSLGETSDAVSKETYTFTDRGGEEITLRPEGTAGVARAFISNGLQQHLPLKLFYSGPMFRYERPQKGRFRQFHQIGVEHLGAESPSVDVECLALAHHFLKKLGLESGTELQINTLGDPESRAAHRDALVAYLSKYENELSPDSKERLKKNPLRILDSKDAGDKKLLVGAPSLDGYLNEQSKNFFDQVLNSLTRLGIPFQRNANLVRGLDYYTHTVFEITSNLLGAQSSVLGGGRYNGLIELLGGPAVSGIGWASGVERLMIMLEASAQVESLKPICILPMDDTAIDASLSIAQKLRHYGFRAEILESGNMSKKMKRASKLNSTHAVILGSDEIAKGLLTVKDLSNGQQEQVTAEDFLKKLMP